MKTFIAIFISLGTGCLLLFFPDSRVYIAWINVVIGLLNLLLLAILGAIKYKA